MTAEEIAQTRVALERAALATGEGWQVLVSSPRFELLAHICTIAESAAAKDAEIAASVSLMERLLTQIGELRQRAERAEAQLAQTTKGETK